jgi:DNA-binding transcriptional regulator YbjK
LAVTIGTDEGGKRRRATQERTVAARAKIAQGAMEVLARSGVVGLTHRAVAKAAGVSLAATTYHFASKADIIAEASRALLDGYLAAFRRMQGRIASGEEAGLASLDSLVERVVQNALGRERIRSLAWCELILHGGRSASGRALAASWYEQLDSIWHEIARLVDPAATRADASAAIDLTVGLTFILHPLGLEPAATKKLVTGRGDIEPLLRKLAKSETEPAPGHGEAGDTRSRIVEVAIGIIVEDGAAGISYGRIAEAAGMVRSGPSYYFPTIDGLVAAAQVAMFERAKTRYRSGLSAYQRSDIDESHLLDLTTGIFLREALEFGRENVGYFSIWLSAAQNASLRPAVASSLFDLHRAWARRIAAGSGTVPLPSVPLRVQALFIGKLIRTIVANVKPSDLSRARDDFAAALTAT